MIVYRILEIDKAKGACSRNSDQNCTENSARGGGGGGQGGGGWWE